MLLKVFGITKKNKDENISVNRFLKHKTNSIQLNMIKVKQCFFKTV